MAPPVNGPGRSGRTRVLHMIQNLNYGGMERLLADLVLKTDPDRFENHVMVLQYVGRFGEGLGEVAGVHKASPMTRWSMVRPASLARDVARIAPDVVHTHSGVWYKGSRASRLAGVPRVVHTEHGRHYPDPVLARLLDRRAARRTDVVVAVSEVLGAQLRRTIVEDGSRVRVVRNGVDTEAFRPGAGRGDVRRELGIPDGVPVIGSVGRLEPVKDYSMMIEALALLRQRAGPFAPPVLILVGDGSELPGLAQRASALGVEQHVRMVGWRDDVHDFHDAFTLFSLSSLSEGTSVSLLEAMSAAICPVVTDVGGNAAVLGPDLAHRLVRSGDPAGLADAWERALSDGDGRTADGAKARRRVVDEFSLTRMIEAYEGLYEGRSGTPPGGSHGTG